MTDNTDFNRKAAKKLAEKNGFDTELLLFCPECGRTVYYPHKGAYGRPHCTCDPDPPELRRVEPTEKTEAESDLSDALRDAPTAEEVIEDFSTALKDMADAMNSAEDVDTHIRESGMAEEWAENSENFEPSVVNEHYYGVIDGFDSGGLNTYSGAVDDFEVTDTYPLRYYPATEPHSFASADPELKVAVKGDEWVELEDPSMNTNGRVRGTVFGRDDVTSITDNKFNPHLYLKCGDKDVRVVCHHYEAIVDHAPSPGYRFEFQVREKYIKRLFNP